MKIIIIANLCEWASWPAKIAAIKAFWAPLVDLEIDIKYTDYANIPTTKYAGTITQFLPTGAVDVPGEDTEIDQTWFNANIGPLITGYDIAVFQTTSPTGNGLPLGIKFEDLNGTWCCETFIPGEEDNYYLSGMTELGNSAEIIISHEISHAIYSITGQQDNTHLYFYANNFKRVLTDISLPTDSPLVKLLRELVSVLMQEKADITNQKSAADMNSTTTFLWGNPEEVRHSIRVKCDNAGLSFDDKNKLTACIYQESNFISTAEGKPNTNGTRDYGLCQYNDGKNAEGVAYWIGPGAAFTSIQEVLSSPEKNVDVMIAAFKEGRISEWSSYSTGAYKQWIVDVQNPVPASGHYGA